MAGEKKEIILTDIKRLAIQCQACETTTIVKIDLNNTRLLHKCPICNQGFGISVEYQEEFYNSLRIMQTLKDKVKYKIVCEE